MFPGSQLVEHNALEVVDTLRLACSLMSDQEFEFVVTAALD